MPRKIREYERSMERLESLVADIERAQQAIKILENVWADIGPYNNEKVSAKTIDAMQRFFQFDDSE